MSPREMILLSGLTQISKPLPSSSQNTLTPYSWAQTGLMIVEEADLGPGLPGDHRIPVARVEIDPATGVVEVTDITAIHDVGKAINRAAVEGQIEGGVATGIGYALCEAVRLKSDQKWVDNFTEYLLPTAIDVPPTIKSIILELAEESGPFGAKGIGEISLVPTAAAISRAVQQAVGKKINTLPIVPELLIE